MPNAIDFHKHYLGRDKRDGRYTITPALATQILNHSLPNRPLSEEKARDYAGMMERDEWRLNGESCIFDEQGRLLDGQHRMRAVQASGKTVQMYFVFGINKKHFNTLDQGKLRSGGGSLAAMGVKHANLAGAICRWLWAAEEGKGLGNAKRKCYTQNTTEMYNKYEKEITETCEFVSPLASDLKGFPLSIAAVVYLFARRVHKEKAAAFVTQFATKIGLSEASPVRLLIKRLAGEEKITEHEKFALMTKAWLLFVQSKEGKVLRWQEDEPFPSFIPEGWKTK